ncbi:creatininase family protein [Halocatena halophila]|uniref:creatininase family protein n=1 Tax=Halocatena halophila TaxID=2814576 RepID=UPI002ED162E6
MSNGSTTPAVAWEQLSYSAIRDCGERSGSILVVPIGSIEQHGTHLPVGTDTLLVDAVGAAGAERLSDSIPLLVTPPIWTGFSPHHMSFGGTITLEHSHMMCLLEDVCASALENGFDALVLLNGHGGNMPVIDSLVSTVGVSNPDTQILGTTYFTLVKDAIGDVRESEIGGMAHGGEFETSLMMHLYPELVGDNPEGTMMDEPYEEAGQDLHDGGVLSVYRGFEEYSRSGAIGAPELANEKKGKIMFERIIDEFSSLLADVHEENR